MSSIKSNGPLDLSDLEFSNGSINVYGLGGLGEEGEEGTTIDYTDSERSTLASILATPGNYSVSFGDESEIQSDGSDHNMSVDSDSFFSFTPTDTESDNTTRESGSIISIYNNNNGVEPFLVGTFHMDENNTLIFNDLTNVTNISDVESHGGKRRTSKKRIGYGIKKNKMGAGKSRKNGNGNGKSKRKHSNKRGGKSKTKSKSKSKSKSKRKQTNKRGGKTNKKTGRS